ncbi:MAG: class I poly(R)-hydroxyalkanoic acid synthase [Alphaproteobacteria bacterium]|nr:class I poly(R)-hydroxyalkanoic acid synthase [Alphaproteobacteria bacterium]
MDGKDSLGAASALELGQNFQRINFLFQRLFLALSRKEMRNPGVEGPGQPFFLRAMMGHAAGVWSNPMKAFNTQLQFWQNTTALYAELTQAMLSGASHALPAEGDDSRFTDEEWRKHPFFYYLKRQYQIMSAYLESLAETSDLGDDAKHAEQVHFFTKQLVDLFSPSNFLASNPVAMRKAVDTNGRSLVEGLENLVKDLERSDGDMLVTLSDPEAFKVGETLAATRGDVVYETSLFQLIRYAPATDKVHSRPLLIIPPWINKFYILDLQPKSSLVKWLTGQGFAVYIVSWRNPREDMRDAGLDTYVFDGVLTAVAAVNDLSGSADCNVVGYCIGGTALALSLSWLSQQPDDNPIRSATFFTSLSDFEDPGPLKVFIDESFVSGILFEAQKKGYLDHRIMARTFSYLRPNDLIYGPAVKAYLLGEPRPKFDLLFWNEDSTRLPERMAREYLIHLYRDNDFASGNFELRGTPVSLDDIKIPHYVVACEKDHIAPWRASFKGLGRLRGGGRFVLAQSGHIAGIVNHPDRNKYGYWVSDESPADLDDWREGTEAKEGSWWPDWSAWLAKRSGRKIDAASAWPAELPKLEPAPGRYVRE